MITRDIEVKIKELSAKFPIITITGPRQSGKTTLVKKIFREKSYISLEDPANRDFAISDPKAFLAQYPDGVILDEVQRCPDLLSYIQTIVDDKNINGMYILTGSQHFLLMNAITQSLAGRTAIFKLLPLSLNELFQHGIDLSLEEHILKGFYPRLFNENILATDFYPSYIETYIERDVRTLKNISNLGLFYKFLKLLAGRTGQLVNYQSLGNDCGLSHNTIKEWISLLETSFIVYTVYPYYKNYNKRVIKTPKIYFSDIGVLCSLLGLSSANDYKNHFLKGEIFENFIINEIRKLYFNKGINKDFYFWRDKTGHEIDLLLEEGNHNQLIEIKSAMTYNPDFIKNINYFKKLSLAKDIAFIVNSSDESQKRTDFTIVSWKEINRWLELP